MTVTISPETVTFGPIPVGIQDLKAVHIENDSGAPITPVLDPSTPPEFRIVNGGEAIADGGEGDVYIEYNPTAVGDHRGTLNAGEASASLFGQALESIIFEPSSFDFGDVPLATDDITVILVTNATGADLELEVRGGDFTASPTTIPSTGLPTAVRVTFRPREIGPRNGALSAEGITCSLTGVGDPRTFDEPPEDPNAPRRLVIDVPTPRSRFYLGKGLTDALDGTFNGVDGCGLETVKNVYIHALGGQAWLQANGPVVIRSRASGGSFVHIASQGGGGALTNVASTGNTFITAKIGLVVGSGFTAPANVGSFGESPNTNPIVGFSALFSAADVGLGLLGFGLGLKSAVDDAGRTKGWKVAAEGLATVAPLAGAAMMIGAAAGALPATTILGQAGISLATFGFGAFYGLGGVSIVSLFPSIMGLVDVSIMAGDDISLATLSGDIKAFSGGEVMVHSSGGGDGKAGKVTIEASKSKHSSGGEVEVIAKKIRIGDEKAKPFSVPQTEELHLGGKDIKVVADDDFKLRAKKWARVDAKDIVVEAESLLSLNSTDGNVLVIANKGSFGVMTTLVSVLADETIYLSAGGSSITISKSGIELKGKVTVNGKKLVVPE